VEKSVDGLTDPARAPSVRFGPDRRLTVGAGLAAAAALVLCVTSSDAPGRVLFAVAALVLVGYCVGDLVWWPRLSADVTGLRIRTPFTRADLGWAQIEKVGADVRTRYGLRSVTLEVDAGEVLVVFGRRSLGADPETVAGLVLALRPAAT
jgi:hypothetical protein